MGIIDDLWDALWDYAEDYVYVAIIDLKPTGGGSWNVDDKGTFSVYVNNMGPLDLSKILLFLDGMPYGKVRVTTSGTWNDTALAYPTFKLDAYQSKWVGPYHYKAKKKTSGSQTILKAHVADFEMSWNHVLKDSHGSGEQSAGTAAATIYPK